MFSQWNVRVVVVEPGGLRTEWKDSIEQLPVHPKYDRPKSPIVESRSRRMTGVYREHCQSGEGADEDC